MPCIRIENGYICMSDPPLLTIGPLSIERKLCRFFEILSEQKRITKT